ncbi:hypothetical protein [Chryseobacterium indoltheticum]|uniref:Uncharacterized protein n=1 Tax=Chryseobacterium indoltheticum TaxID=254 RepID=A0A381FA61_9FLAO|nr:hypothetical protein [Chryseobacterium indoltheticum]SUX43397.1 Uncharacterised protein [Chryseobacterium indoltheticum]
MENISEIISHFNFTQTRKSKQYLASFFNQKSFNKNQTLYTQQKLKMFLENFQLINDYKSSENIISSIQKFLGEVNTENYNLLTKIMYGEFFNQTNNNITLFIEFFYRFGVVLKNFQKSDCCKDYSDKIDKYTQFIDSLSVNEYHHKVLDFKQRKNILTTIEAEVKNGNFISYWNCLLI